MKARNPDGSRMAVSIGRVFCRLQRMRCVALCLCWPLELLLTGSGAVSQTPAMPVAGAREFDCVIEPQQIVKLASPVVGMIARLDVDRGDIVRQGQVVGKIEDGVEAATLALARARATNDSTVKSAEARLQFLRRKHERLDELHTKFVTSLAALQEAEAEARVAEQQLREAQHNRELARLEVTYAEEVLNQRTLRSPINGVVVERLLVPGEYRNDQSPVLTLAQIDPLRVEVFVPTAHFGKIRVGSEAEVRPEQPIKGTHVATVTVVDHVLDAASGTFGVRLILPNPQLVLPAGIRCKVTFAMHPSDVAPALVAGDAPSNE
jgi:RND family efflux transporter MFP subunit